MHGNILYIGHMRPPSGTTMVDISDPRNPRKIAHEGATLSDVVRITTYLQDVRDFGRYNRAFTQTIGDAVMAHTTVEARAVINTKIEMDAIVCKPLDQKG